MMDDNMEDGWIEWRTKKRDAEIERASVAATESLTGTRDTLELER